jgi:hypothetical protein
MPFYTATFPYLCVGTPSLRNGKLDLGHIEPVCLELGRTLKKKYLSPHRVAEHRFARNRRNAGHSRPREIERKKMGAGIRSVR